MGRMINIFELSAGGMAGRKLLTDKAHRDGSPVRKIWPDMKKATDPIGFDADDKPMANDLKKSSSVKRSAGTPVKMLIAEEMSKEMEPKGKPPSLVARLMGLDDALPVQEPILSTNKRTSRAMHTSLAAAPRGHQKHESGYFSRTMPRDIHWCSHEMIECKDVYEVRQQPPGANCNEDGPRQIGRRNKNPNEKRMVLVRQKFMEAKRLATDEKLLQSKEFQDALEVLSSNRDLFLRFLEEPNSLFSRQIKELHTVPPAPQAKRITVLKPSKTIDSKCENQMKRQQYATINVSGDGVDKRQQRKGENLSQPTRIVVLKPSPGKPIDMKAKLTPPTPSPEQQAGSDLYEDFGTVEAMRSREVAKEITQQMRDNLSRHQRDESLLSSVLSNGYGGDDSSFSRSENEYVEEDGGSLSDSEIVTPTSRHSWDYANRFGSPYSLSSYSRASFSPESSVVREAKKRLSERWALVATNGISQDQMQVPKSSSTLGEMLSIPEVKKEESNDEGYSVLSSKSCRGENELRAPAACLSSGRREDGNGDSSLRSLSRSKSVPVSASIYETFGMNVETSDAQVSKQAEPKKVANSKNGKSFFKGKLSSFFFSRSKKQGRGKPIPSPSEGSDDKTLPGSAAPLVKNDDVLKSTETFMPEQNPEVNFEEGCSSVSPTLASDGIKSGIFSSKEVSLSLEKPRTPDNVSVNQEKLMFSETLGSTREQPSPTSVLDAPFEDNATDNVPQQSGNFNTGQQLLSRSTPIESISRTSSWGNSTVASSSLNSSKQSRALRKADDEEKECFMFIQKLLSSTGLDGENSDTVFAKWYSPDSPFDPMLLDKFLDRKEEAAKCRERRSNQRLLFDFISATLLEIGQATLLSAYPWTRASGRTQKDILAGIPITAEVWRHVRNWLSGRGSWVAGEAESSNLLVDRVVRSEVEGRGWAESMRTEVDEISRDISVQVLEELVGEALIDFCRGCLC